MRIIWYTLENALGWVYFLFWVLGGGGVFLFLFVCLGEGYVVVCMFKDNLDVMR